MSDDLRQIGKEIAAKLNVGEHPTGKPSSDDLAAKAAFKLIGCHWGMEQAEIAAVIRTTYAEQTAELERLRNEVEKLRAKHADWRKRMSAENLAAWKRIRDLEGQVAELRGLLGRAKRLAVIAEYEYPDDVEIAAIIRDLEEAASEGQGPLTGE